MSFWRKLEIKINNRVKTPEFKKKFLDILTILSIISGFFSLLYSNQLVNTHEETIGTKEIITFIAILIYPILLIIFGYKYRKRWYNTNTKIVIGMMSIMAIIFSLLITIFIPEFLSEQYKYDFNYVNIIEKKINFALPDNGTIKTVKDIYGVGSDAVVNRISDSYIEFEDTKEILDLNERIKKSEYWTNRNTSYLKMIEPSYEKFTFEENIGKNKTYYYLIYNKDLKTYNEIPNESGKYNYIMLVYNDKTGKLIITEYKLEFIK